MDPEIDKSIKELKSDFINIMGIRSDISQTFKIVERMTKELEDIYGEYIKNTKEKLKVFGLNPFYFQCKLVKLEYDELHSFNIAIANRMYCEYFKLHKIIVEYIEETVKENNYEKVDFIYKNFPIYKDLEPFKEYDFSIICKIHDISVSMIEFLVHQLIIKETHMKDNETRNKTGLFINNFVNTLNYDVIVMREKILLFIHDLGFFHKLHIQYLKRFYDKMLLFNMQLNDDLKLNSNTIPSPLPPPPNLPVRELASLSELVPSEELEQNNNKIPLTKVAAGGGAKKPPLVQETKSPTSKKSSGSKWNILGKKK